MDHAPHSREQLTPEERRARLRAFADRMLLALDDFDPPETGEEIDAGIRRALMIERLYARVDASEAVSRKRAIASIQDQVTLKNRIEWSANWLDTPPSVDFVTLRPQDIPAAQGPRPAHDAVAELKARIASLRAAPESGPAPEPTPCETPPLSPAQARLRERIRNTPVIAGAVGALIHDEDVETIYGARLTDIFATGHTRESLLKTVRTFSREDLNACWPNLFPLDTT